MTRKRLLIIKYDNQLSSCEPSAKLEVSTHLSLYSLHHDDYFQKPMCFMVVNSLKSNKILHWTKLKAFADNNLNMAQTNEFVLDSVENILRKGENHAYQHVLLVPE